MDDVESSLQSAKNWGTFDMLGGGIISTAIKHSRINDAKESIHQVQHQLRVFQRELADIGEKTSIEMEIGTFAKFADYVFDGLIFDWIVQSKINNSLESALRVSERIRLLLSQLQNSYQDNKNKLNNLEQQRLNIIEQA